MGKGIVTGWPTAKCGHIVESKNSPCPACSKDELALEQARITGAIDGIVGKQLNQTQFLLLVNQFREWDKNQEQIQEASK
jgi:hypothetical protein